MPDEARKNILFIFTDQQRYDTLSFARKAGCRTPNLDRLAEQGMWFDNAYTVSSICSPARASILTGVYPHAHGVRTNTNEPKLWPNCDIDPSLPVISQQLKEAGYRCGYSGKWHCGEKCMPSHYGFEGMDTEGYGKPYNTPEYQAYLKANGLELPHSFLTASKRPVQPDAVPDDILTIPGATWLGGTLPGPAEACEPAFVASHAIDLMRDFAEDRRTNGTPFFQVAAFWGPHHPYYIPEPYASMYNPDDIELWPNFHDELKGKPAAHDRHRRSFYHEHVNFSEHDWKKLIAMYWGYCTFIDAEVGRLLDALEETGPADETAVIFTTDHGDTTGCHGGLFDKGSFMYEETYHIPLIARVPGMTTPGSRCDALVSNMDIASTILELAGVEVPEHHQGASFVPLLRDPDADWRDDLVCEFHGLRLPYYQRMLRWRHYKYVYNAADWDELYDLDADPHEMNNRIDDPALRDVADECRQRLLRNIRESRDVVLGTAWQHLNFAYDDSTSPCVPPKSDTGVSQ